MNVDQDRNKHNERGPGPKHCARSRVEPPLAGFRSPIKLLLVRSQRRDVDSHMGPVEVGTMILPFQHGYSVHVMIIEADLGVRVQLEKPLHIILHAWKVFKVSQWGKRITCIGEEERVMPEPGGEALPSFRVAWLSFQISPAQLKEPFHIGAIQDRWTMPDFSGGSFARTDRPKMMW